MTRYAWGVSLVCGKLHVTKKRTIPKAQLLLLEYLTTAQFLLNMRLYSSPQIVELVELSSNLLKAQNRFVGHETSRKVSSALTSSVAKVVW